VGKVEVECHVLPHKDMLSPADHQAAAGPDGWNSQQGFYVYRNGRLLLAGGWLGWAMDGRGIVRKPEACQNQAGHSKLS